MNPLVKLAIDLGPLLIFFAAYARAGIMAATAAFMVATVVALGAAYGLTRRIPILPLVTGAIVLVFGGLTLVFADDVFIKLKPTVVNALLSAALFGGLAFKRPLLKPLFEAAFQLDAAGWRVLTFRWACFFAGLAALNEIVWRSVSTDSWVTFKVFGLLPLTLLFSVAQVPFIRRHSLEPERDS
jgi:intracellular septation protein